MRFSNQAVLLLLLTVSSHALTPLQPRARVSTPRTVPQAIAIPVAEELMQEVTTDVRPPPAVANLDLKDAWVANLDYEGFGRQVAALGKELQRDVGTADVEHLNKVVAWRNAAAAIGLATFWMTPNPLTILALSTWTYASWTMIAHHTVSRWIQSRRCREIQFTRLCSRDCQETCRGLA
jgi:hypothetical protein